MAGSDVTAWPDRLIPVSILFAPHHCSRIRCIVAHDPSLLLFGDLIETLVRSSQLLLQCCCLLWQISTVYLTRKTDRNVQARRIYYPQGKTRTAYSGGSHGKCGGFGSHSRHMPLLVMAKTAVIGSSGNVKALYTVSVPLC